MRGFDMTQAEFAERIGISQNYLSTMDAANWEWRSSVRRSSISDLSLK
jgi:transcriptional regulator with XRE-family HTH domain